MILAITGCSGVIYGARLLKACRELGTETYLIVSPAAEEIMGFELDDSLDDLLSMATRTYEYDDLSAPPSSGSVKTDGMIIAPCSMKTMGSIANGVTSNLITRAADVTLKESRRLVLVPRETPLSLIHLESMAKLKRAGATILPAAPGFYHDPKSIEELVDFVVGRILEQFGIEHRLYEPWKGQ